MPPGGCELLEALHGRLYFMCILQEIHLTQSTLSAMQTETDSFANSVDPDGAQNEPSHLDLQFASLVLI